MPSSSPGSVAGFDRVAVVLLRPRSPGNVGSVARAMKNMGFSRLVVADPEPRDDPRRFEDEAARMAWNAADLLIARVERPDLAAALSPFTLVVGTTSRPAPPARVIPPREAAAAVSDHLSRDPGATAALLFGQEDIGLTREVQSRCHLIGSIPVSTDYPSLNLAQAALVFLYELRLALSASPTPRDAPDDTAPPSQDRMEAFFERLESTLEAIDFFQGTARSHMMRELRALFNRAVMTRRELAIFEGIVHRVDLTRRKGSRGPGAPPPLSGP